VAGYPMRRMAGRSTRAAAEQVASNLQGGGNESARIVEGQTRLERLQSGQVLGCAGEALEEGVQHQHALDGVGPESGGGRTGMTVGSRDVEAGGQRHNCGDGAVSRIADLELVGRGGERPLSADEVAGVMPLGGQG